MAQLNELTTEQLKRAVEIKEQIDALNNELDEILGGASITNGEKRRGRPPGKRSPGRPPGKGPRKMSAAAKAAISAAQKRRWAKQRGEAAAGDGRKKRKFDAAWRAKISKAAKERWAKRKAAGKNSL
jgi:hypothetical protein